jgi:hypothetical protein
MQSFVVGALGIGVGSLIALSPDLAVPLVLLLLPSLVVLLIDQEPSLGHARAMLLFQAAACFNPVRSAWYQCSGLEGCLSQLCQPAAVMRAWLCAAAAWLLTEILPIALKLLEDYRLRGHRAALQRRRQELAAEWGLEEH